MKNKSLQKVLRAFKRLHIFMGDFLASENMARVYSKKQAIKRLCKVLMQNPNQIDILFGKCERFFYENKNIRLANVVARAQSNKNQ